MTIIRHYYNYGKSLALMQGFDVAKGEIAVTLDADLQDRPEMIGRLLECMEEEKADCVIGWRHERSDFFWRKVVSRIFNIITAKIFRLTIHDINSGLRAFTKTVYKTLELHGDMHRLIPAIISMRGYKVSEVKVDHDQRKFGKSRYPIFRHRGILDILSLLFTNATKARPFHTLCEISFLFWLIAFLAFFGWFQFRDTEYDLISLLCAGVGGWFILVATIMPLFGIFLEIQSARLQNKAWRKRLNHKTLVAKD